MLYVRQQQQNINIHITLQHKVEAEASRYVVGYIIDCLKFHFYLKPVVMSICRYVGIYARYIAHNNRKTVFVCRSYGFCVNKTYKCLAETDNARMTHITYILPYFQYVEIVKFGFVCLFINICKRPTQHITF